MLFDFLLCQNKATSLLIFKFLLLNYVEIYLKEEIIVKVSLRLETKERLNSKINCLFSTFVAIWRQLRYISISYYGNI